MTYEEVTKQKATLERHMFMTTQKAIIFERQAEVFEEQGREARKKTKEEDSKLFRMQQTLHGLNAKLWSMEAANRESVAHCFTFSDVGRYRSGIS